MACNRSPIDLISVYRFDQNTDPHKLSENWGPLATVQTVRSTIARVAASLEAVLWDSSIVAACGAAAFGIFSDLSHRVSMPQHLGKIAHVDERAADWAIAEMIEFRLGNSISLF